MPSCAVFLMLATFLPMVGAMVVLALGKKMGTTPSGWIATGMMIAGFLCTLLGMVKWYEGKHNLSPPWGMGERPIHLSATWARSAGAPGARHRGLFSAGIYIDSLTVAMFAAITFVGAAAHAFAVSLAKYDPLHPRFFAITNFLCFSVMALLLSSRLIEILIFLEAIALATQLLARLNTADEKPPLHLLPFGSLIGQCLADAAMIVGVTMILATLGNVTLPTLWTTLGPAASGNAISLSGGATISVTRMTIIGLLLCAGAAWRSAQFPWQAWAARMADRAPAAAAVVCCVATMASGVYLLARFYPILTPGARLAIAIAGATTLTMAGLIAVAQDNLLRLLGWIAVSQVGMATLAIGVGSWGGGLFLMLSSAFFMSLLFLAAASVVAAAKRRRLSELGGLGVRMPVTFALFAIGALALAGAPLFGGHASQSIVFGDAAAFATLASRFGHRGELYWALFFLPLAIAFLNAFSIARCGMLIFVGTPRDPDAGQRAREHSGLWGPMLLLAVPSIIAGYAMNIPELLRSSMVEAKIICNERLTQGPRFTSFDQAWPMPGATAPSLEPAEIETPGAATPAAEAYDGGHASARLWLTWPWLAGIAGGYFAYRKGYALTSRLLMFAPVRGIIAWLGNEMYFGDFYFWLLSALTLGRSARLAMRERRRCGK